MVDFNLTRVRLKHGVMSASSWSSRLQPHESSSETNGSIAKPLHGTSLQPHESSSETRSQDRRRLSAGYFNLTRVRLKLLVFDFEDGHCDRFARTSTSREFV